MKFLAPATDLQRSKDARDRSKVAFLELFFDLVFVFAITQLSHSLATHFTPEGALRSILLLMAVWWVWIYTTWVTNWLDPHWNSVRLLLFVLMLAGLYLSMSIPDAFGDRGLAFGAAYAFMQISRSLFMCWALRKYNERNYRNFQRVSCWLAVSGVLWIAGGFVESDARFIVWLVALAIEYISPAAGFWIPRLGRSVTADWDISGEHLAERCGLFMIIALGESILVTGATHGHEAWTSVTTAAFASAFVGTVAMWRIYFNFGAEGASERIGHSDDPGRIGRIAYTYLHVVLIAGLLLVAVSDEMLLAHPLGHVHTAEAIALLGGPALYLFGNLLFKRTIFGRFCGSHIVGMAVLGLAGFVATRTTPLALGLFATSVLVAVATWESYAIKSEL